MSLLLPVLLKTACPTTHHKLAIDALRFLRSDAADAWRDLFLRFHKRLLAGAAAPDEEFQDFGNHVHYVGERPFGGATAAARQWFDQLKLALTERRWADASFAAGVLSHYVSDPFMPLCTRQSEAGNLVQPAIQWCVNRSYGQLQTILEEDFGGYPAVEIPSGSDGPERLIERGAQLAASHYDALVEHFDPVRRLLDPEEALDQELQDRLALCLGAAVVSFARILELAIEQSAVGPPKLETSPGGLIASLKAPFRILSCHTHDQLIQRQLEAMHDELELTGRVIESLPLEQREVRRLYADEVLHQTVEQLADNEVQSSGNLYGQGARPRYRSNRLQTGVAVVRTSSLASELAALTAAPDPAAKVSLSRDACDGAPAILPFGVRISRASPIDHVPSLPAKLASRLRATAIDTIGDLLAADPVFLADRLRLRDGGPQTIMVWQAVADLCCQIPQLGGPEAQLLVAAGIRQPSDITGQTPQVIVARLTAAAESQAGRQIRHNGRLPGVKDVVRWQTRANPQPSAKAA